MMQEIMLLLMLLIANGSPLAARALLGEHLVRLTVLAVAGRALLLVDRRGVGAEGRGRDGESEGDEACPRGYQCVQVWSDANDDQQEQPDEVREYKLDLGMWISNWYMPMTQTMIFYGGDYRIAPTGWTACGAPLYDLTRATRLPATARHRALSRARYSRRDGSFPRRRGA